MLKKDENKHYIGFHKPTVGVCSDKDQVEYLNKHCDTVHSDLNAALSDMDRDNECLVVMNEIVLGSAKKILKIMNRLCVRAASLYSVAAEFEYDCCNPLHIERAVNAQDKRKNTLLSERTGRARGGRPPLLDLDAKKEIFALNSSGTTFDTLMGDYDVSRATLSRIMKQGRREQWGDNTVANQKKRKKK